MNTLEHRVFGTVELRLSGEGKSRTLSGHAAVFNSFSQDMGFREIIRPGAFEKTLAKNPDVRLLLNHEGLPLARTTSGTLRLREDKRGLHFEADLDPEDPDVQRIAPKVKRGDLDQMSFAFRTIKDTWRIEQGQDIRELHELDLHDGDVSVVTYPAYKAADVAIRSREMWKSTLAATVTGHAARLSTRRI
jgi:HK97 family phage prohead protease